MMCGVAVGFLSQIAIAWHYGASADLDAYLIAFALPSVVAGAGAAAIGYVLIPLLMEYRLKEVELSTTRTTSFLIVVIFAVGVALGGMLLARPILETTAPGATPARIPLIVGVQQWLWVATALSFLVSFATALHHFEKSFVRPAIAVTLPPLGLIFGVEVLAGAMGITGLAFGYVTGVAAQCGLLWPGLRMTLQFDRNRFLRLWRRFTGDTLLVLLSLLPFTALPVIDAYWASRLPDGSLSYLGYANRIVIGLTSITVHGVAVVLFPYFSESAAAGAVQDFRNRLTAGLKFVFLLLAPLTALFIALRLPVLTLLFERGTFDAQATRGLAAVLPWYLVGMVGMAAMNIVSRGFYALGRSGLLVGIGLGSLAFYAIVSGLLAAHFSYVGIGITYALYWTAQLITASVALGFVMEKLWCPDHLRFLLKLVTASLLVGALLQRAGGLLPPAMGSVAKVALLGGGGMAAFLLMAWLSFTAAERLDLRSFLAARETVSSDKVCITNPLVARPETR